MTPNPRTSDRWLDDNGTRLFLISTDPRKRTFLKAPLWLDLRFRFSFSWHVIFLHYYHTFWIKITCKIFVTCLHALQETFYGLQQPFVLFLQLFWLLLQLNGEHKSLLIVLHSIKTFYILLDQLNLVQSNKRIKHDYLSTIKHHEKNKKIDKESKAFNKFWRPIVSNLHLEFTSLMTSHKKIILIFMVSLWVLPLFAWT